MKQYVRSHLEKANVMPARVKPPLMLQKEPSMSMTSIEIIESLQAKIIGQGASIESIVPYITAFSAGLTSDARPIGNFLLLGPSGTGKTHSVECLADVLHGDAKKLIRVDCGQFTLSHEVAKLLGAPAGYLGHRETTPLITQKRLAENTTDHCPISIVLFDEIEKAHSSLFDTLLSITDKASLSMGDNSTVSFANSLIFFTSNIGARQMAATITPELGFGIGGKSAASHTKMEKVGMVALKKKFSPEFLGRIDEVIVYNTLTYEAVKSIFTIVVDKLRSNIYKKHGDRSFLLVFSEDAISFLISKGYSDQYGARELSRILFRHVTNPLSDLVTSVGISPGAVCRVSLAEEKIVLTVLDHDIVENALKKIKNSGELSLTIA